MKPGVDSEVQRESIYFQGILVVQAVISELVSAVFSLFYGKIQGNSRNSARRQRLMAAFVI
jgi:hypothetical protein